jgi:hypothetical protein
MIRGAGIAIVLLFPALTVAASPPAQWIVVTAPAFRKAVEPLCQQRKKQGLQVVVVQTTDVLRNEDIRAGDGGKLREHLHKLCRQYKGPSSILLVGAIESGRMTEPETKVVPALTGSVSRMKGQPSDSGYGCLEDGGPPTVAVGRFPARSEAEARGMTAKTLEYEDAIRPGPWRRRLTILAGIPAYNPLVDRMVESLAMSRLAKLSPMWTGRAIYSNPQSRFCLPDGLLHQRAERYVRDGEAITLYLGHSNATGLYGGEARYLDREDWSRLDIARGKGVFFTFGCYGCQLKGEDGEGYGVAAIRNANGPAAVAGSHGICFAAMVQLAADGLFESTLAKSPPERLGDSWLALLNGLARGKIDDFTYRLLDTVDGDKSIPQATQRREHLEMFVLLGDPALRLPRMDSDVVLSTEKKIVPGEKFAIRGTVPQRLAGARIRLTLERTVDSKPENLQEVPNSTRANAAERDRILLANHERANRFVLDKREAKVEDGCFQATLEAPAKLPWPRVVVRAYAANSSAEAMTVQVLEVGKKTVERPQGK